MSVGGLGRKMAVYGNLFWCSSSVFLVMVGPFRLMLDALVFGEVFFLLRMLLILSFNLGLAPGLEFDSS